MRIRYTISFLLAATLATAIALFFLSPPRAGIQIFLVDYEYLEEFDAPYLTDIPFDSIDLPDVAILDDSDILKYDWTNHTMTLTSSGSDKLPRRGEFYVASLYFILAVDRTPCYIGSIETHLSSDSHKCPTILIDDLPARGGTAPIEIEIAPCYPEAIFSISTDEDVRYNERLKSRLDQTNRLQTGG